MAKEGSKRTKSNLRERPVALLVFVEKREHVRGVYYEYVYIDTVEREISGSLSVR